MRPAAIPFLPGRLARTGPVPRALLAASLAAVFAAWFWPIDPGVQDGPGRVPPDLTGLAARDTGEALRRPVFDPQRRDWTAGGSLADVMGEARPSTTLTLRGVIIDARAKRAFVDDGTLDAGWLGEGDGRGSWRIVAIEPGRVVIAHGANRHTLDFLGEPVRLRPALRLQRAAPAEGEGLRTAL